MFFVLLACGYARATVFNIPWNSFSSVSCQAGDTLHFTNGATTWIYINTVFVGSTYSQGYFDYTVQPSDTMYSMAWLQAGVQPTCGGRICTCNCSCPNMAFAIAESSSQANVIIANPVQNILAVKGNTSSNLLQLFNAQGQCVLEKKIQGSQDIDINVQHLPRGLYLLVLSGITPISRKIVLE